MIDPISGPLGTLEYDHGDGISITGGFVYRGSGDPGAGRQVCLRRPGDSQSGRASDAIDGRLFYADLEDRHDPSSSCSRSSPATSCRTVTVHGFGQDGDGELYALVTNTPANGTGGIVYKFVAVPEPSTMALVLLALGGWLLVAERK